MGVLTKVEHPLPSRHTVAHQETLLPVYREAISLKLNGVDGKYAWAGGRLEDNLKQQHSGSEP
jgi:hypothetical protein